MQRLTRLVLAAALAASPACAHQQLTNRDVAYGATIAAGIVGIAIIGGIQAQCSYDPVCSAHQSR